MVLVREIGPEDWQVLREIRLAALLEAPFAFGSSYEREVAFTEAEWRGRLTSGSGTFLAYLPKIGPAGIAGALREQPGVADAAGEQPDPGAARENGTAELVGMWVSPRARGRGVGGALITAAADWAKTRGFRELHLWVTATNSHARGLYERHGFVVTGESQPLPSDPSLTEMGMRRQI